MITSINVLLFIVTRVGSMISCFKEREEHKSLILAERAYFESMLQLKSPIIKTSSDTTTLGNVKIAGATFNMLASNATATVTQVSNVSLAPHLLFAHNGSHQCRSFHVHSVNRDLTANPTSDGKNFCVHSVNRDSLTTHVTQNNASNNTDLTICRTLTLFQKPQ